MDLNEIKNRAKDLLADLTDNRPDREERPAPGRADDAVDESAVRTDRLEPLPHPRTATDPHHADPIDRDPIDRDPIDRDPIDRDPIDRDPIDRDPIDRDPIDRDPIDPASHQEPGYRQDDAPQPAAAVEPELVAPTPGRHALEDQATPPAAPDAVDADGLPADPNRLVTAERAQSYGARWDVVKGEFVDEPRQAVAKADALVGELLGELAQLFTQQRRGIEQDLDNDEVSTEDLRVALRRYRSFFDRLLSV